MKLGSIGKHCKNSILRSQLVCGAMTAVTQAVNKKAKTKKTFGLKGLLSDKAKNVLRRHLLIKR
jgi:transposase